MQWEFVVALLVAIPIILFPVAFVWYLNASGLYQVLRDRRHRQKRLIAHEKEGKATVGEQSIMTKVTTTEHTAGRELVGTKR
jgi:hypothetical protein